MNKVGDGRLDFRHKGKTKMTLTDDGKVGIGTTSPGAKLQVVAGTVRAGQEASSFTEIGHWDGNGFVNMGRCMTRIC